jgi:hypothetical protein
MQGPAMNKPDSMVYIAANQKIQNSIAQETAFFFLSYFRQQNICLG